jgi:hypothetical protein
MFPERSLKVPRILCKCSLNVQQVKTFHTLAGASAPPHFDISSFAAKHETLLAAFHTLRLNPLKSFSKGGADPLNSDSHPSNFPDLPKRARRMSQESHDENEFKRVYGIVAGGTSDQFAGALQSLNPTFGHLESEGGVGEGFEGEGGYPSAVQEAGSKARMAMLMR